MKQWLTWKAEKASESSCIRFQTLGLLFLDTYIHIYREMLTAFKLFNSQYKIGNANKDFLLDIRFFTKRDE